MQKASVCASVGLTATKPLVVGLLALLAAFPSGAAVAGNLLSYKFVMQQNCIFSQDGFTSDFDIIGGGGPLPIIVIGAINFDVGNQLAFETDHAMQQFAVYPPLPPPGTPPSPSGAYPVRLFESQCVFDFHLASDLSFTIAHKGDSCKSRALNGPDSPSTVVTNVGGRLSGQFSPDFGSFVGGTAADTATLVETVVFPNGNQIKRICETTMQGARVPEGKR